MNIEVPGFIAKSGWQCLLSVGGLKLSWPRFLVAWRTSASLFRLLKVRLNSRCWCLGWQTVRPALRPRSRKHFGYGNLFRQMMGATKTPLKLRARIRS